jgi:hypothetical protein
LIYRPHLYFFADKRFEISNQNLSRDITLIIELGEIVPSFEYYGYLITSIKNH